VNKEFTASVAEKSMPLFMAVFLKFTHGTPSHLLYICWLLVAVMYYILIWYVTDQHIIEICRE